MPHMSQYFGEALLFRLFYFPDYILRGTGQGNARHCPGSAKIREIADSPP